jgi:hypothetical protein
MRVYAICKNDGSLACNQSFANQQEAENEINTMLKEHKELCKTFNRPQNAILLSVVQLEPADYEVALEKMDDELVKALNELEIKE